MYSFGYALELQAGSLAEIMFWLNIQYIVIPFLPTIFFILAIQYTRRQNFLKRWLIVLLFLFSLTTLLFHFTNFNDLYYKELKLTYFQSYPLASFVKGPWYWIHQGFSNILLLFSIILFLLMVIRTRGLNRIRASIMLLSSVVPWLFYIIYLSGNSPHNLDLLPFSFSIVGILSTLGIFRYRLLDLMPVALDHVFDSLTDGLVIMDTRKRLISFNNAALELIPELSVSMKGRDIYPALSNFPVLANPSDGIESDVEITRDGILQFYHLRVVAVNSDHVRLLGWAIIFTNITGRKQHENKLLETKRNLTELNASKDKFLAIIAHDLRNSFHLMINMSDMIRNNIENDNKADALRKSKIMNDISISTYNLLQNLLEWAMIQQKGVQFRPKHLQVKNLLEDELRNLHTLYEQKELVVRNLLDSHLAVTGDKDMLKTVFRNLVSNAIKYSYHGGEIRITGTTSGELVTIEITDQGTGMSAEEKDNLFKSDSYLTRKGTAEENGSGLGLKLCKEFINLHGGEIRVTSTPGKGSTFAFTVAAAPPHTPQLPQ
jgi:signal transduction histidine kinase